MFEDLVHTHHSGQGSSEYRDQWRSGAGYSRVIELPKLDISVIKSDPAKHAATVQCPLHTSHPCDGPIYSSLHATFYTLVTEVGDVAVCCCCGGVVESGAVAVELGTVTLPGDKC